MAILGEAVVAELLKAGKLKIDAKGRWSIGFEGGDPSSPWGYEGQVDD
jgi:hypothetical protein